MARRHDSDSGDDSPAERRGRHDRKPSARSNNRRSDSSDSDRGRKERVREREDLDRARDRRGKVEHYSDSDKEEDGRRVERRKGSDRERIRERDDFDRVRDSRGKVEKYSDDDKEDDSKRGDRRKGSEKNREMVDLDRDRDSRGKAGQYSDSDKEEDGKPVGRRKGSERNRARIDVDRDRDGRDKAEQYPDSDKEEDGKRAERRKGSEKNESRDRHLEEEDDRYRKGSERESGRARGELQERKRDDSPRVSDGEEKDLEREDRKQRKERRHRDEEDRRVRRHRSRDRDRKRGHESSEEDERSRRGKERNVKSRYDDRRRDDDESRRRDRHRVHGRHREEEEKESHRKVAEDAKVQKQQPTIIEGNPAGDVALLGRTGGVYIPPFKLARMMKEVEDKSSPEYQRLTWDALRKSINGLVNKVNATNIKNIIPELLGENLIRGRGLFCRAVMKSQFASPGFTDVFAALVAVVNTKFPDIGELLLKRIVLQLRRAYKRNDKPQLLAAVKFVAHLVNQQVANEIMALELLMILLDQPTDDSVEVAVGFVTECGSILQDISSKALHSIFERFRGILHEGEIDKRVQFLIEGLFAIRKAKFQGYPAIRAELDLVEPEDQFTHQMSIIEDEFDQEISLDIFRPDPNYLENEKKYEDLKKSILGEESQGEESSDEGSKSDDDDEEEDEEDDDEDDEEQMAIRDETETNLVNLRRTIYLTIMSSVDFEEAGHKLLKIKLEPGQEMELCIMLLECCSQERTYLRYYGLLGQRFCMINKIHQVNFETCFVQQYSMIHRLETNKLRNVAKFFAHLLGTDALPWQVLQYIRLTEEDTTSSSRIFIKILFQELGEQLGIRLLNERLNDPAMQDSFESIFPRDNPRNTRFAINFFTSIGLGGITENLREYLKNMPRMIMQQQQNQASDEESGSGSDSGSSSSSESESSESSSDESDREKRRKRRRR